MKDVSPVLEICEEDGDCSTWDRRYFEIKEGGASLYYSAIDRVVDQWFFK